MGQVLKKMLFFFQSSNLFLLLYLSLLIFTDNLRLFSVKTVSLGWVWGITAYFFNAMIPLYPKVVSKLPDSDGLWQVLFIAQRSRGKSHLYCLLIFWLFGFAESQFPLNNRGSNNESSYFLRAYHVPITKAFRQVLSHSVTTEACMANPITTLPPNLQMRRLREREAHWIVWGHRHQMSLATGLPHQQPSWACWHIFGEGSPSISPHSHASVIVTSVVPKRWLMDSLLTSSPSYS